MFYVPHLPIDENLKIAIFSRKTYLKQENKNINLKNFSYQLNLNSNSMEIWHKNQQHFELQSVQTKLPPPRQM